MIVTPAHGDFHVESRLCFISAALLHNSIIVFFSAFQTDRPTVIEYDDHEYLFEGFSLFSHTPLTNVSLNGLQAAASM